MSFNVALTRQSGEAVKSLDETDPRGHITLVLRIADYLGLPILANLDPYETHVFFGETARALGSALKQIRDALNPDLMDRAKRDQREHWLSYGPLNEGYEEWFRMATIERVRTIVEHLQAYSERAMGSEDMRLMFYGD